MGLQLDEVTDAVKSLVATNGMMATAKVDQGKMPPIAVHAGFGTALGALLQPLGCRKLPVPETASSVVMSRG
jgi:hypothetical protein